MGLGHYNSLGEYCHPHNASSVFLIIILISFSLAIHLGVKQLTVVTDDRMSSLPLIFIQKIDLIPN